MDLGFIGFGEASFELAKGLRSQGFGKIVAYNRSNGTLVKDRAVQANVELVESLESILHKVSTVIVSVPADQAIVVSEKVKPHLREGIVYVDVSASTPDVKKTIWKNIRETGAAFVDAAMMGPLTVYQHKVPMLLSGSGSDQFMESMKPFGMDLEKLSNHPGDASAIKLIRSIYMKGIATLLVEVLETARHLHVDDLVVSSLKETMENNGGFEKIINQLVTGTSIHALRRSKELEGTIEMLASLNIDSQMAEAARNKLLYVSDLNLKDKFQGQRPKHWSNVIDTMAACKEENKQKFDANVH